MSIRDDARQEAERRYPALNPDAEELTYPRSAIRRMTRGAFVAGAAWRDEQADRGCGHPNHRAEDHDCAPFLPDREQDEDYPDAEGLAALRANREPSEAEELARLRLERLEAVEDFITRHYLDTQMGERVLAIVNGIEEVHRG